MHKIQYALTAAMQALESLRDYGSLPPPDARADVLEARENLLRSMPEPPLSQEQLAALAYLVDGQDAALMAYLSGVSPRRIISTEPSPLSSNSPERSFPL